MELASRPRTSKPTFSELVCRVSSPKKLFRNFERTESTREVEMWPSLQKLLGSAKRSPYTIRIVHQLFISPENDFSGPVESLYKIWSKSIILIFARSNPSQSCCSEPSSAQLPLLQAGFRPVQCNWWVVETVEILLSKFRTQNFRFECWLAATWFRCAL